MTFALTTRYSTPAERMRGCFAAEGFEDAGYLARNGGTVVGAVPILPGRGAAFPGTVGNYVTYEGGGRLDKTVRTFVLEFWPDFAPDDGANHYFFDSTPGNRFTIYKSTGNNIAVDWGGPVAVTAALGAYSAHWRRNKRNVLVCAIQSGNSFLYLNGFQIATSAVAIGTINPTTIYVGSAWNGTANFSGRYRKFQIYNALLTQQEAQDFYDNSTYTYRNKAVLDLPMLMADHDPVNARTLDRSGNGLHASFGAGAATPTKLARRGYSFDGGDYMSRADEAALNFGTGDFSVAFISRFSSFADYRTCISKRISGGAGWRIYANQTTGDFVFQAYDGVLAAFGSGVSSVVGSYYVVVFTRSGSVGNSWVNGVFTTGATRPGDLSAVGTPLEIGRFNTIEYLAGEMLKADLFGFALTPVQALDWHVQAMAALQKV